MKREEMWKILHKYSLPLGFGGWKMCMTKDKEKKEVKNNDIACITTCIYEKTLEIFLGPDFYKKKDIEQKNIIIHELIHARVCLKGLRLEKMENQEEELMVNDIVNCIEEAMLK